MRILITGATGMLGTAMRAELKAHHELIATDIVAENEQILHLDIKDWKTVQHTLKEHAPDLVLHLAAETDVDRCEREPEHAFATNALGTENIAWACHEQKCTMVYVSTANVFDGEKPEPYTEYDEPGPVNIYGQSKLEGERIVTNTLDKYFILRAGWMVGGWEIDKKFVFKVVQLCRTEQRLKIVDDKFGSPTFTVDFAQNLMSVVNSQRFGLYHMANRGSGSRLDIAKEVVSHLAMQDEIEICPVSSLEFSLPAPRPRSEMMHNLKLELIGLNNMPHWKDSLKKYITENVADEGTPTEPQ